MSSLSMVEARLPPGFRFHPRDDELVLDYLSKKLAAGGGGGAVSSYACPTMVDVDLNKCEPWDLPDIACVGGKEWYFYSLRDRKYATGQRTNRATESGYWKATGKDRPINRKGLLVGMRKTLVFYQGRAPKGKKTDWVMHEFRKEGQGDPAKFPFKEDWVLCRVFFKSRATIAKPAMETCYNDTASTSLPPLIDNYIAFDGQAAGGAGRNLEGYGQVPCFSNPSSHQLLPPPPPPSNGGLAVVVGGQHVGPALPELGSCDKKAIKEVLSQFGRFEGNGTSVIKREVPQSFATDGFESYLAESGLSQMWNSF